MLRKYLLAPLSKTLNTVHSEMKQLRVETAALRDEVAKLQTELREIVKLLHSVVAEMRRINQVQQQQLIEREPETQSWKM